MRTTERGTLSRQGGGTEAVKVLDGENEEVPVTGVWGTDGVPVRKI